MTTKLQPCTSTCPPDMQAVDLNKIMETLKALGAFGPLAYALLQQILQIWTEQPVPTFRGAKKDDQHCDQAGLECCLQEREHLIMALWFNLHCEHCCCCQ